MKRSRRTVREVSPPPDEDNKHQTTSSTSAEVFQALEAESNSSSSAYVANHSFTSPKTHQQQGQQEASNGHSSTMKSAKKGSSSPVAQTGSVGQKKSVSNGQRLQEKPQSIQQDKVIQREQKVQSTSGLSRMEMLKMKYLKKGGQSKVTPPPLPLPVRAEVQRPRKEQTVDEPVAPPVVEQPKQVSLPEPKVVKVEEEQKTKQKIPPPPPPQHTKVKKTQPPPPTLSGAPAKKQKEEERDSELQPHRANSSQFNTVQQILARRLKKQEPKREEQQHQTEDMLKVNIDEKEQLNPSQVPVSKAKQAPVSTFKSEPVVIDAEYEDRQVNSPCNSPNQSPAPQSSPQINLSLSQMVDLWLTHPSKLITTFNPHLSQILDQASKGLTLHSAHPSYLPHLSPFLLSFVFESRHALTSSQKDSLYDIALEFFFSDANQLSQPFLLVLLKLGRSYLQRYSTFFSKPAVPYHRSVLKFRDWLLPQQLGEYVNFVVELEAVTEQSLYQLLLISPSESLMGHLQASHEVPPQSAIMVLSVCQLRRKEHSSLLYLYFKMISQIADQLSSEQLDKVLKHLGELEVGDKYYQIHKQVKLKVIKLISGGQSSIPTQPNQEKEKTSNEGGFMGMWSKAMDKFKTATTHLTQNKPQKKQEPEGPEDKIEYDPIKKRYVIDGQVPQDPSERDSTNKTIPAPPPPRKGNNSHKEKESNSVVPPPAPVVKPPGGSDKRTSGPPPPPPTRKKAPVPPPVPVVEDSGPPQAEQESTEKPEPQEEPPRQKVSVPPPPVRRGPVPPPPPNVRKPRNITNRNA